MTEDQQAVWRNVVGKASNRQSYLNFKIVHAEHEIAMATSDGRKAFAASQLRGYRQELAEADAILAADAILVALRREQLMSID